MYTADPAIQLRARRAARRDFVKIRVALAQQKATRAMGVASTAMSGMQAAAEAATTALADLDTVVWVSQEWERA